ncbi:MAG: class I SAM-dependent methyltransferase [Flavobacteriales bacterium]|jgi:SAM-dependent methyltransferase
MTVEQFFNHLLQELDTHPKLKGYYRFLNNEKTFEFRKAYYIQRLEYIEQQIKDVNGPIWDIGCGYGTTALFLALNGYKVHGSTLEYYFNEIPQRLEYWSKFGDISGFTFDYENLYDSTPQPAHYAAVIVQDTLHHTEPIEDAVRIIKACLKPGGKVIAVEENGNNLIQSLKLFVQRGNKRIIDYTDERLGKTIKLGNENIRPYSEWKKIFEKEGFTLPQDSVHYVRFYPPFFFKKNCAEVIAKEQEKWKSNSFLRERFFFGLNFTAVNQ